MPDFFSQRFGRFVRITHHARKSMENRQIDHNTLYRVIEEGQIKERDEVHVWIYLNVPGRMDNLILPPPLWPMR